jgi:hypothetical protein
LWLAFTLPLIVYVLSAYRDVGYWDVGEMDTVPWILGIAHPTGFPAYVLSGWLFAHALPIGSVAFRMSVLSAVAMSLSAWAIARTIYEEHGAQWLACMCALVFAFGDVVWVRATRAEVHALAAMAIALTIYFTLNWYRTGDDRALIGAAIAWGFGIAVHPVVALIAPGLLVLVCARLRAIRIGTLCLAIGLGTLLVTGFYAYLPLRSLYVTTHRLDPTRQLGLPPGRAFWDDGHPASPAGFFAVVSGSGFDVESGLDAIVAPAAYQQRVVRYLDALAVEFSILGLALILLGLAFAFTRDRWRATALVLSAIASVAFAFGYPEEADYQRYFLTSFVVGTLFLGDGAAWFGQYLERWRFAVPVVLALCALWLGWSDRVLFRQAHDASAAHMAATVIRLTPRNAVVIVSWTYATPLAYDAYVERETGDRVVETSWIGDVKPYLADWLAQRPVYVVGPLNDDGVGYRAQRVWNDPLVYRVEKE